MKLAIFLIALVNYSAIDTIETPEQAAAIHSAYCQNLYWQPDALERMEAAYCDIELTGEIIHAVQSSIR